MFKRILLYAILFTGVFLMLGCNNNGNNSAKIEPFDPPAPQQPTAENRIALVIANADYTGEISPLQNPLNDADSVANTLKALNFKVTKKTNLTRADMIRNIQVFAESINKKNVVSLFYYAGHGFEKDGKNYLVPIDATSPEDVNATGYDLSLFIEKIDNVQNLINLVFLDACREELSRSMRGRGGSDGRGFGDLNATGNVFIGYATARGKVAADAARNQSNSPFTKSFIRNMRMPDADMNTIFQQIVTQTMELSPNNQQRPYSYNSTTYTFVPLPVARNIVPPPNNNNSNSNNSNNSKESCDELIAQATDLFEKADYAEAKKKYAQAMRLCPEKTFLAEYIATCERSLKNPSPPATDPPKKETQPAPKTDPPKEETRPNAADPFAKNMVLVNGGTYTMGCTNEQGSDCFDNEKPAHDVTLSSFYISRYEVTQSEWRSIMGNNPSYNKDCDECPVEMVSWNMVQDFLKKLNNRTGQTYSLPTEAEWEYAARGGSKSKKYKYAGSNNIGSVAWYDDNSGGKTHAVGGKAPNELGLYDMSGNVLEWCADRYGPYNSGTADNPKGPGTGTTRVVRGGSWSYDGWNCRVSRRHDDNPDDGSDGRLGFRVVRRL